MFSSDAYKELLIIRTDLQQRAHIYRRLLSQIAQQQEGDLGELDAQVLQRVCLDQRIDMRILIIDDGLHGDAIMLCRIEAEQRVVDAA